ncbi:MAG: peptide deformylase [Parcubacteria group bacterium]|jgi:peptide deformylase|nr:peptide deformylase [Parcubacteria group bacterium]|tara:strand:+ start:437 stop:904 length:468 start_codon:yes stop_codon:yes gene_type:complete
MENIVDDIKLLKTVCEPCSVEEGRDIAKKLFLTLSATDNGVGLAANQIGINKKVCVINVKESLWLVNPKIIGSFGKIMFEEQCLSFPGESVRTSRFANIFVKSDNHSEPLKFGSTKKEDLKDFEKMLECVCVQHEIDHLNGLTMFDREVEKGFDI